MIERDKLITLRARAKEHSWPLFHSEAATAVITLVDEVINLQDELTAMLVDAALGKLVAGMPPYSTLTRDVLYDKIIWVFSRKGEIFAQTGDTPEAALKAVK